MPTGRECVISGTQRGGNEKLTSTVRPRDKLTHAARFAPGRTGTARLMEGDARDARPRTRFCPRPRRLRGPSFGSDHRDRPPAPRKGHGARHPRRGGRPRRPRQPGSAPAGGRWRTACPRRPGRAVRQPRPDGGPGPRPASSRAPRRPHLREREPYRGVAACRRGAQVDSAVLEFAVAVAVAVAVAEPARHRGRRPPRTVPADVGQHAGAAGEAHGRPCAVPAGCRTHRCRCRCSKSQSHQRTCSEPHSPP